MFRGESDGMMDRMVAFAELAGDPDDRCVALMRRLMRPGASGYLEIGISIEPDLLQLTDEVWDFLSGV